jgi:ABC-type xylose transport system permease subunit
MGVLNSGMSLPGLGTQVQSFVKGIVLLLAVDLTSSASGGRPAPLNSHL